MIRSGRFIGTCLNEQRHRSKANLPRARCSLIVKWPMRIIKPSTLRRFWLANAKAEKELRVWIRITRAASWKSPADVKRQFGARVDFVKVASGNTVAVFDIANNNYRLVAAIHYDCKR